MSASANLALPFIEGGELLPDVTLNETLRLIDTLVQLAILDRDLNAPPGSPAEGQRWIVKAADLMGGDAGSAVQLYEERYRKLTDWMCSRFRDDAVNVVLHLGHLNRHLNRGPPQGGSKTPISHSGSDAPRSVDDKPWNSPSQSSET